MGAEFLAATEKVATCNSLKRLAEAEGIDAKDAAALLRMDRKRKKKTSNEDWNSPSDEDAEITKLDDKRFEPKQLAPRHGFELPPVI